MKKFTKKLTFVVVMVLTLALFFSVFVACNNNTNPDADKDPGTTVTPGGDDNSGDNNGDDDGQTPVTPDEGGDQTPGGDDQGTVTPGGDENPSGGDDENPSGGDENPGGSTTPAFAFPEGAQKTWYTSEGYAIVVSASTLTYDGEAAIESGYYTSTNATKTVTYYHFSVGMTNTPYAIYTDGTDWYLAEVNRGNVLVNWAEKLALTAPTGGGEEGPTEGGDDDTPSANTLTVGTGNLVSASNEGEGWDCMPATEYSFTAPTDGIYAISSEGSKCVFYYNDEAFYAESICMVTLDEGDVITIIFGNASFDTDGNFVADTEANYEVTVEKLEEIPAVFIGEWTGKDGENTISYTITSSSVMDQNWAVFKLNKIEVGDNELTISAVNMTITYNSEAETITVVKGDKTVTLSKGSAGGDEGDGDDTPSTPDPIALNVGENTVSANASGVSYKFTATEAGKYSISCESTNSFIYEYYDSLTESAHFSGFISEGGSQTITLAANETIIIKCCTENEQNDTYTVVVAVVTESETEGDGDGSTGEGETPSGGEGETPSEGGDETPAFAFPEGAQKTWYLSNGTEIVISADSATVKEMGSEDGTIGNSYTYDKDLASYNFKIGRQPYSITTNGTDWYCSVNNGTSEKLLETKPVFLEAIDSKLVGTWIDAESEDNSFEIAVDSITDPNGNKYEMQYGEVLVVSANKVIVNYGSGTMVLEYDEETKVLSVTDGGEAIYALTKVTESAE